MWALKISRDLEGLFTFIVDIWNEVFISIENNPNIIRSNLIIIFCYLETLFWIYISYEKETSNWEEIREFVTDTNEKRKFFSNYLLNKKNSFFKENSKRFGNINAKDLIKLRNHLIHYYTFWEKCEL